MPVIHRRASIVVSIAGTVIDHVKSISWSGGFNMPYNEGSVVVTQLPASFNMDQEVILVAGNGTLHTDRFHGLTRSPIYNLDGTITIQCVGHMAKVYEYENSEDPLGQGGLLITDLTGNVGCTDQEAVVAVLHKVGVPFDEGDIGGTGVVFGLLQFPKNVDSFVWSSGGGPTPFPWDQGKGESALDYISKWDMVSAVHPGPFTEFTPIPEDWPDPDNPPPFTGEGGITAGPSPGPVTGQVGFFRTYETLRGEIHRVLIGGRPRSAVNYTFTEGVDIRMGQITRGYPQGNRFLATGYDPGLGDGPTRFVSQSSNDYQHEGHFTAPPISSPFIEKWIENEPLPGMSCEKVAYAQEPDYNRITVHGTITTGRDDYISAGMSVLVQGAGGIPSRLGTGEPLWVQAVRGRASIEGFEQELEVLGGGVPDNYLPDIPV